MMEPITIATLASGAGAWFVTTGILVVLKETLGPYWNDLANRLATLLLPMALVEVGILATAAASGATVPWWVYLLGVINGLLASRTTKASQKSYDRLQLARGAKAAGATATKARAVANKEV